MSNQETGFHNENGVHRLREYQRLQAVIGNFREHSRNSRAFPGCRKPGEPATARKHMTLMLQESTRESGEHFQNSRRQSTAKDMNSPQGTYYDDINCEVEEHSQHSSNQQWCKLSEVVDSDFLISPGDIYPNRKVELEDADIKEATKVSFEVLCE